MMRAYEEVVNFIAAGTTPEQVANFRPSSELKERVELLLSRRKDGELSREEADELEHFAQIEYLMRLAKARARNNCKV